MDKKIPKHFLPTAQDDENEIVLSMWDYYRSDISDKPVSNWLWLGRSSARLCYTDEFILLTYDGKIIALYDREHYALYDISLLGRPYNINHRNAVKLFKKIFLVLHTFRYKQYPGGRKFKL